MVTKVVTEHDVDNVTIIINSENKLQAQLPDTTSGEVVIEEVPNVTTANDVVTLDGTMRKITKLGKVSGTEWLVFQLDNPLPPKPTIQKNIRLEFYDDVGVNSGDGVNFSHSGKVRVITEDGSPFTPNGDPVYVDYPYLEMRMEFAGSNGVVSSYAQIDFIMMTYRAEVSYNDVQMRSSLTRVLSWSESFSAEHEDAFYDYNINSASRGADTPAEPEPSGIDTYFEVDRGEIQNRGDHYELTIPLSVQVVTSDVGSKTPKTVKFDVVLGSQTRTYSYPYSASNTYEWNSINDFTYEGHKSVCIDNARVEFTDGSSSSSSSHQSTRFCVVPSARD